MTKTRIIQFFGNISRLAPERADELSINFRELIFHVLMLCSSFALGIISEISRQSHSKCPKSGHGKPFASIQNP
jgi:hypothetical protein